MHQQPPLPFGLAPVTFPQPALATLAGRLPLGGGREVALAALLVCRLSSALIGSGALAAADRVARASAAKVWLASLALPAQTRAAFARCIDATAGSPLQVAGALRSLLAAAGSHLDGPSVLELETLVQSLSE